jgi:hypothetical protein
MIEVALRAEPLQLTEMERKNFKITISATNRGGATVDPELHRAKLLVNGKESRAWSLAIGNGKRETKWFALPPGETVSMTWSSLGESLLAGPGEFSLVVLFHGKESVPTRVQVLAAFGPEDEKEGDE